MRCPDALLALLLALVPGCALLLPSRAQKEASFEPFAGATVAGVPLARFLKVRTSPLLVDARLVTATATGADYKTNGYGSAAAIAEDGYFLTAAHCLATAPSYVLIVVDGCVRAVPARVVWAGDPDVDDIAIVHLDGLRTGAAFAWAPAAAVEEGTPLASTGFALGSSPQVAGGSARGPLRPVTSAEARAATLTALVHDVPVTFGDSGGPVVLRDGRLVGINVRSVPTLWGWRGVALRPDPAWVRARIEADRGRSGIMAPR